MHVGPFITIAGQSDSETDTPLNSAASCSVVVDLNKGDWVQVFAETYADSEFIGAFTNYFNGFLIKAKRKNI